MNLASWLLLDSVGNTVGDYSLTAQSGHNYLVPEPAPMALLALGCLLFRRR